MGSIATFERSNRESLHRRLPGEVSTDVPLWLLGLVIILLFCQIWFDVAGLTVRLQDVLIGFILARMFLLPALVNLRISYFRSKLNAPLLLWCAVIVLGIFVTLAYPYTSVLKKDSVVNGVRLILAVSLFFIIYNHRADASTKVIMLQRAVVGFSVITTLVSILQIGYWDGWLPFSLPSQLTTLAEGANTARGREIFGLFLGDTGSHTWAGMLAMQAFAVWLIAQQTRHQLFRSALLVYFGLLVLILVRVSVRNSILGLAMAIVAVGLIRGGYSRYRLNRLIWPTLVIGGAIGGLLLLFIIAPESYFVERIREVIPQWQDGRLYISRRSNIYGRIWMARIGLAMFASSPFLGLGYYSFRESSLEWSQVIVGETQSLVHAHNSYIQVMAELGLIGILTFMWVFWRTVWTLFRTRSFIWRGHIPSFIWQFAAGNLVFLAFTSLFSNNFLFPYNIGLNMIVLSMLLSVEKEGI